jgi:protein tyrosine/serine phosphatase
MFFLLIMAPVSAFAQDCLPAKEIKNFGCVSPRIYRGAQPTEQGLRELARRGVKTIISLRDTDEKAETERKGAEKEGIKFYNIPFANWLGPKDTRVEEVLKLINSAGNQPVFIHCKRGADRTGTVVAAYRISHDHWTAKQAKEEAKKYRFGWWQFWMDDFISDYYKKFGKSSTLPAKR